MVKSGKVGAEVTMINSMPAWWSTIQWKLQYPKDEVIRCNLDIEYLKEKHKPDDKIRFCPDLSAPRKTGRPPKGKRIKGAIELALEKTKQKKWKTVEMVGIDDEEEDISVNDENLESD